MTQELSEEQKFLAYKTFNLVQELETDLENAKLYMREGKFFDALDLITTAKVKAQISNSTLQEFIKELQNDKIWV